MKYIYHYYAEDTTTGVGSDGIAELSFKIESIAVYRELKRLIFEEEGSNVIIKSLSFLGSK